ncbi:MAG: undecaprenyl-diphosphate phosphatase [Bacteroidaceae bacterium]|nr:undecaprenyl-diphosphate phosphatase [Bacteroidaceae bacterium]
MGTLEAFLLGLVQGLTEYLPVSSSGHLTIGSALLGVDADQNLVFTVAVHVATVLSTIVVLGHEILKLIRGSFCRIPATTSSGSAALWERMNAEQRYVLAIIVSMIPVGIVGVFFKDTVEEIFGSGLLVVGLCLLVTASLLAFSYYAKPRQKDEISLKDAFIIGLAQAVAVLPGISRSGSTIATGLLLGNRKESMAQFSFLMVIPPILGEALLDTIKVFREGVEATFNGIGTVPLLVGFLAAFVSGVIACKWMIGIVRRGKLIYFAYYCVAVGLLTIVLSL